MKTSSRNGSSYKFSGTLIVIIFGQCLYQILHFICLLFVLCRWIYLTIIHLPFLWWYFFSSRAQFSFHAWRSARYFFFKKYVTNVDMMWLSLTPHSLSIYLDLGTLPVEINGNDFHLKMFWNVWFNHSKHSHMYERETFSYFEMSLRCDFDDYQERETSLWTV